ncbi:MAG: 1,4-alpha-glucan branching protein GlgB [Bacteroidetes bacterium]|jgi:1,4-alpha-glucan branching enzyme|nr:1,4-alpha-glucan branching protein GlgB [Bacteroidota bacterium]
MPWLDNDDAHLWQEARHFQCYEKLGAHPNQQGTWFATWAPHADGVAVIGDFNDWNPDADPMRRTNAGLWEVYVRGAQPGQHYKFRIQHHGHHHDKTDPYAFAMEPPTGSAMEGLASRIVDFDYDWGDTDWMEQRQGPSGTDAPLSIYEVHLGSWRRHQDGYSLSYREIAEPLADHVEDLGFTHVEFMPLAEHPYYGSWGYQIVGYYAPTFRYGDPEDLMYLIDYLHQRGIGVIMDWVPGHFATDPQGLVNFDGTPLYEYEDPQMRHHPDWGTYVFDYVKPGVKNFLIANALFWMETYHIDGLRVDAVASMLYRDYSRGDDWTPNMYGGRENLEAIDLLKCFNEQVYSYYPEAITLAEESTAWPGVSQPTFDGGLGFLYKWNMGWMHDTLEYMQRDPVHRQHHHNELTFPLMYAFSEKFTLPLSHDEVVHGKGSLWDKMPGDDWQKAANLRLLYTHMFGHPGKKLLFMGDEFGQRREWDHDGSVDWHLAGDPLHEGVMHWVRDINRLYREHPALWNDDPDGFEWIDFSDSSQSVIAYRRRAGEQDLIFVLNFTPVPRHNYRIGVPAGGTWRERLNSDAEVYRGSGVGNGGTIEADDIAHHGRPASLALSLPPLGALVLERA